MCNVSESSAPGKHSGKRLQMQKRKKNKKADIIFHSLMNIHKAAGGGAIRMVVTVLLDVVV